MFVSDRWQNPVKAGALLVKEGDGKWNQRHCLIKNRQLFCFSSKPVTELAEPCARVFLDMCSKIAVVQGGGSQVVKITEKVGSKTRIAFLASKSAEVLENWRLELEKELQEMEEEREAGKDNKIDEVAVLGLEERQTGHEDETGFDTTELDHRKTMDLKDLVSKESPSKTYGSFTKIGRGNCLII